MWIFRLQIYNNLFIHSLTKSKSEHVSSTNSPIVISGNAFFASDFHFGAPNAEASREREVRVVQWLEQIAPQADHLFLLGDIFDFWFEYKDVVPKGYYLFFSQLAKMRAKGTEIYFFTGNHDMWVKHYLEDELGMKIFRKEQLFEINGKRCLIGHGDGLDPKDRGYRFIKWVFAFPPNIALYGALPPRWAFAIARACSRGSRAQSSGSSAKHEERARKQEQATLTHIRQQHQQHHLDYVMYGHRHLPMEVSMEENLVYFNTGDWLTHSSYLQWVDGDVKLGEAN